MSLQQVIPAAAKNPDVAWSFIETFTDLDKPFITWAALDDAAVPGLTPIDGKLPPPFNESVWAVPVQQLQLSVPPQYPYSTWSQFGDLENMKPLRLMLGEIIFKNMDINVAADRACNIINQIFLPPCTMAHVITTVTP